MILGLIVALAIPVSAFVVAALWDLRVLDLGPGGAHGPNHAVVQTLFSLAGWELVLGPVGILIGGWLAGVRGARAWWRVIIVAGPVLAVVWFFAEASLSLVNGTFF